MEEEEESQWQANNMTAEAHRLATEAAQMTAAAVLMRKVSVEFTRHQSGQKSTVATRGESLEAEVPMEEENEGETQTTLEMMELELQGNAASAVDTETPGTRGDGSETNGKKGGRSKRSHPQIHKNQAARSGRHKKEQGRYKRKEGDGET